MSRNNETKNNCVLMNMDERREFDTCPRRCASVFTRLSGIEPLAHRVHPREREITRQNVRRSSPINPLSKTNVVIELFSVQIEIGFTALSDFIQLTVGESRLDLPFHCTGDRNRKDRIVCLNSPSAGCSYTGKTTHLRTHRHAEHDHVHPAQWRICASLSQRRTSDKTFKDVKADTMTSGSLEQRRRRRRGREKQNRAKDHILCIAGQKRSS